MILFEIQLRFFMAFTLIDEAFLSVLQYDNTLEIVPKRHRSQYNSQIYSVEPAGRQALRHIYLSTETHTKHSTQCGFCFRIAMTAEHTHTHSTYSIFVSLHLFIITRCPMVQWQKHTPTKYFE